MVRINIILPEPERDAFDRACRYNGKVRQSMNHRLRELIQADVAGRLNLPRTAPPPKGWAARPRDKR